MVNQTLKKGCCSNLFDLYLFEKGNIGGEGLCKLRKAVFRQGNQFASFVHFIFLCAFKCRRGREGRHPSFFVSFLERGISYSHKVVFHVLKTSCTRLAFMSISR